MDEKEMPRPQKRGLFISFEGPECAGKTTQIAMLGESLAKMGLAPVVTREPGGTVIGEELRKIVKHHVGESAVVDEAELLIFAASRAQHVKKLIAPALDNGQIVVCDRYADSTTAYQGYGRGISLDFILALNRFATCGLEPDITFILDLSAEESYERGQRRQETLFVEDRIESAEIGFHRKVRNGFLKIAEENPGRVQLLSAMDAPESIHENIFKMVKKCLLPS